MLVIAVLFRNFFLIKWKDTSALLAEVTALRGTMRCFTLKIIIFWWFVNKMLCIWRR